MRHAGGPAGLGEVAVDVVLETLAAGAGRLSSEVCIRHLWALLTFSDSLLCMGFDPICTDNPSSQNGTRLNLSGPAPSFSQAATCGACGNLLGTHSGVTQRCSGEHLYPVRPGTNGCGPLPLFPCKLF